MDIREEVDLDKYGTAEGIVEDLKSFAKRFNMSLDNVHIDIDAWEEYGSPQSAFKAYLYRPATSEEIEKERVRIMNSDLAQYKRAQEVADQMAKKLGIK